MFTNKQLIGSAVCAVLAIGSVHSVQAEEWITNGNGLWTDAANWSPASVPNAVDAVADFSTINIGGHRNIDVEGPVTVGSLLLGDTSGTHTYRFYDGTAGVLTFDVSSGNALDEAKRTRRLLSDDIDTSSAGVARQHSFSIGAHKHEDCKVTPDPPSPQDKASPKAKGTRKKKKILFKRAIKAVTKKRLIQPLSQSQHIPKKSFLDGGFYAPGNLRLHHQILQSDLDRERRKEKKRRKRKKKDKSYVPPSVPATEAESSVNMRDNSFDQDSVFTSTSSNFDEEVNDIDIMFGEQSPYHPKKRKYIWNHFVRMAKFDHESKRLVSLMAPYTLTALICNMFAIVEIALISSVLGAESLSAFLVTGYFLSMVYKAAKGFT